MRGVRSLMRVTRVLLAVAVLWIATAPASAPAFEAWTETAAMIAAPASSESAAPVARPALASRTHAVPPPELTSAAPDHAPTRRASRRASLASELYLRNCALLC